MYNKFALASLVLTAILIPSLTFAKNETKPKTLLKAHVNAELIKRKVDVQVSLVGKVTAINATTLTLLASNGSSYTVDVSQARFVRRFNGVMQLAEIQLNDQLYVQGSLLGSTIRAKLVQDLSLQTRNGTFNGTVVSLSGNSFVLQSQNRGQQTVSVSNSTKILKGNNPATMADIVAGASVRVDGIWNSTNNNVNATKIQISVKQEEVRLHGTVSSVSGTTLSMSGSDGKTYTVDAAGTKLAGRNYFGTEINKIKVGDSIQIWGKMVPGSLQIKANVIIDFSL